MKRVAQVFLPVPPIVSHQPDMTEYDAIVIGHGLAGAALAWALRWRGYRVLILDRGTGGASRVAAGLVTPITGLRLVRTGQLDNFYPLAVAFYRQTEVETGAAFFSERPAVRLFLDSDERSAFDRRQTNPSFRAHVRYPEPPVNPYGFAAPHGGFEMTPAARLDVGRYLDASRDQFEREGGFRVAEVDPERDGEFASDGVRLPRLAVRARWLIFCQGWDARANPWFPELSFTPAQGEILTVRIPELAEARTIHRGVWLAPTHEGLFRVGSTYDRDITEAYPTVRGRKEIEQRLREFLRLPFEVVGHAAGVRPILAGGKPVIARHPTHRQLIAFNGLGSKGTLLAPYFAAQLANSLL